MAALRCFSLLIALVCGAAGAAATNRDKLYSLDKNSLLESDRDAWFESLSEQDLRAHWSHDDGSSVSSKVEKLKEFEAGISVEVRLVGFRGDGNRQFKISPDDVHRYFEALPSKRFRAVALKPAKGRPHELPVVFKPVISVTEAPQSLIEQIHMSVQAAVQRQALPPGSTYSVPVLSVDHVIREHYQRSSLSHTSYVLYVLNPPVPKTQVTTDPRFNARYQYTPPEQRLIPACAVNGWIGEDGRYAWVDLTAQPVTYGPQTSGTGIVTEYSFPNLDRLQLRSVETAESAKQEGSAQQQPQQQQQQQQQRFHIDKHEFLAELVASLRRTMEQLVLLPLSRLPVPYHRFLAINIIVIRDTPVASDSKPPDPELQAAWDPIVATLRSLALPGQHVNVDLHVISFNDCELCVQAYTHSLRSHTSNVLQGGLRTQIHQYLDSAEMQDWLEHFDRNFWNLRGTATQAAAPGGGAEQAQHVRTVSAFIYDLRLVKDILLLDRFHQSVPLRDMVVAVQTQSGAAFVDYTCEGQTVTFDPRDASRAVLASLLDSVWGVAPTYISWNPVTQEQETNYLWNTGPTPFGYFSQSKSLSFSIRDAIARNMILSDLTDTTTELSDVFRHFAAHEKDIDEVLTPEEHLLFVRRWNVLSFKLERTLHFVSLCNFNQAWFYLRSARHDLKELHRLVHEALSKLAPRWICSSEGDKGALSDADMADLGVSMSSYGGFQRSLLFASVVVAFAVAVSQTYPDSFVRRRLSKRKQHVF